MGKIRRIYSCDFAHPDWAFLMDEDELVNVNIKICPVCGEKAVAEQERSVIDRPIIKIENGAFYDKIRKGTWGEKSYTIVLEDWEGVEGYRSPYFYNWSDTQKIMEQIREMTFQQATSYLKKVDKS